MNLVIINIISLSLGTVYILRNEQNKFLKTKLGTMVLLGLIKT